MGCESIAKLILIIVNILFFLLGGAALGVGIWVLVDSKIFLSVLSKIPADTTAYGSLIQDAGYILIAGGAAIFLIAFLGCCGAWKKNKCMLMIYAIILGIILLLEIGCAVVGYFFFDNFKTFITDALVNGLATGYESKFNGSGDTFDYSSNDLWSKGVDAIQLEFECCGVNNYTDYGNKSIPVTCCKRKDSSTTIQIQDLVDQIWAGDVNTLSIADSACYNNATYLAKTKGCYESIYDFVMSNSTIVIAIAGATAGVQFLLLFLACCLFCVIRSEENKA